ncbi:uncharacterized protein LOC134023350 [Osmerus eperlanus]|uniref:uncharacterized protein LOC134023350 n=1 Tax=Osmerus eperlanus TaxID=29151 RepID=UPI002E147F49
MECSKREVSVFEEQHLEPLIIVEEGDITENTVVRGPETMTEKSCDDEDSIQEAGQIEKLSSKSEEDGNPGRYPCQVKQEYNIEETNRYSIKNKEENTSPGSDKVEEPGGGRTEENENNQKIIKKETDGETTGRDHKRQSQVGFRTEEIKAKNTEEDPKLHIETSTQALQVDTNKLSPSDQPLNEMFSTVDTQKQARRLTPDFPDTLYELLCTLQEGRRLNDQRCSFNMEIGGRRRRCHSEPSVTMPTNRVIFSSMTSLQKEEFFEFVATSQARRLDDQRAELLKTPPPKPKANRIRGSIKLSIVRKPPPIAVPKEDLYNMILSSQAQGRLEEQRSAAPGPMDDEDFFSLLLRVQGGRMEEQRTELSTAVST